MLVKSSQCEDLVAVKEQLENEIDESKRYATVTSLTTTLLRCLIIIHTTEVLIFVVRVNCEQVAL